MEILTPQTPSRPIKSFHVNHVVVCDQSGGATSDGLPRAGHRLASEIHVRCPNSYIIHSSDLFLTNLFHVATGESLRVSFENEQVVLPSWSSRYSPSNL